MEETKEPYGPDLERIGLFKEMSYLGPMRTTSTDEAHDYRPQHKGKQMMTSSTKTKDASQQGYFSREFPRAFDGDGYLDVVRLRRNQRFETARAKIGPEFKYIGPTKKPSGKGSDYGTFIDPENKLEYFSSALRASEREPPPKRNFYVNPPKKGSGYGYPNVTIGKMPLYSFGEEPEKSPIMKKIELELKKLQPYKAGIFQQEYFDPNPYSTDKKLEGKKEEEQPTKVTKIFWPTNPTKKDGGMKAGCLNKYPEYLSDPYPKEEIATRGVKSHLNEENKMFRPFPGPKPYPIKSIITKNVERKIIPTNFNKIKGVVYCNNKNFDTLSQHAKSNM